MRKKKILGISFAILAAVFYAISIPCTKFLLDYVESTIMAGLLYLGAGIGIGLTFLSKLRKKTRKELFLLDRRDIPYIVGMVLLDILAPILLMYGLLSTTASNASLLNNFEIVSTSVIALCIFKEKISKRLWIAIILVTMSSIVLSVNDLSGLNFSWGSILVLAATVCWGFENNCTRKLSSKSSRKIVTIKGLCSGFGALLVGVCLGEHIPDVKYLVYAMLLGFVAYGLSITFYIRAQRDLGAAKTSTFYGIAPFIGSFLSFAVLKEKLSGQYILALFIMVSGIILAIEPKDE